MLVLSIRTHGHTGLPATGGPSEDLDVQTKEPTLAMGETGRQNRNNQQGHLISRCSNLNSLVVDLASCQKAWVLSSLK